jgi:hypothetical protein
MCFLAVADREAFRASFVCRDGADDGTGSELIGTLRSREHDGAETISGSARRDILAGSPRYPREGGADAPASMHGR